MLRRTASITTCAAAPADVVLALVHLRNGRRAHGRKADQFHHRGHGVGGELAAARARAGTRVVFDFAAVPRRVIVPAAFAPTASNTS